MFLAIPQHKIGKHTKENIFLIKIPKNPSCACALDVPYGMKAYVLWKCQLVGVGNLN